MVHQDMKKKADRKEAPARKAKAGRASAPAARVHRAPAYRINRRFPESSSSSRQLQLLLAGSTPLLRQKLRGAACRLRSFFSALALRAKARQTPSRHRFAQTAVFLTAGLLLTVFAANRVLYTTATTLSFQGRALGTVASEEEAQEAVKRVESSISQVLGSRYSLEPDSVSYTTGLAYRGALVEEADLDSGNRRLIR